MAPQRNRNLYYIYIGFVSNKGNFKLAPPVKVIYRPKQATPTPRAAGSPTSILDKLAGATNVSCINGRALQYPSGTAEGIDTRYFCRCKENDRDAVIVDILDPETGKSLAETNSPCQDEKGSISGRINVTTNGSTLKTVKVEIYSYLEDQKSKGGLITSLSLPEAVGNITSPYPLPSANDQQITFTVPDLPRISIIRIFYDYSRLPESPPEIRIGTFIVPGRGYKMCPIGAIETAGCRIFTGSTVDFQITLPSSKEVKPTSAPQPTPPPLTTCDQLYEECMNTVEATKETCDRMKANCKSLPSVPTPTPTMQPRGGQTTRAISVYDPKTNRYTNVDESNPCYGMVSSCESIEPSLRVSLGIYCNSVLSGCLASDYNPPSGEAASKAEGRFGLPCNFSPDSSCFDNRNLCLGIAGASVGAATGITAAAASSAMFPVTVAVVIGGLLVNCDSCYRGCMAGQAGVK